MYTLITQLYHELTPLLFDFVHLILCIKCTLEFLKVLHNNITYFELIPTI